MRGDEVQPASGVAAGSGTRERTGPRHAAPRKSLLTKLQMPAGKAIALAAMPTAVLMGMGLTPRLASADELPKNPFSGTKCVEQPDEPSESARPGVTPSSGATKSPTATPTPSVSPSSDDPSSGSPGSGDGGGKGDESGGGSSGGAGTTAPEPSASPSATKQSNPLDPLGVGDALGDLLGLDKKSEESATATPSPSTTPAPGATSAAPRPSASTGTVKKAEDTTDTLKKSVSEAVEKLSETTGKVTQTPNPSQSSPAVAEDGKTPFPCPTHDAQALADAAYQETQSLLPDDPWVLRSSLLTLTGLDYKGIVEVKTWSGKVKKVLKFTATGVDIKDLRQEVVGPNGTVGHVDARKGSTSTIRNGTVTMYTESLKGNLFGLIPIEFTPDTPPPINVPAAFFTNVTVEQAGQFGGTLKVPGMHVYNTAD
ncbi:hydrogenase expression protein HypF [Actinacidiphila glaucinigra]|uniref:hydrogenase expression protein HypF n=1 Tax=Actinacidiphila glaucinigra TaxID=235986 RepID=UPI003680589D